MGAAALRACTCLCDDDQKEESSAPDRAKKTSSGWCVDDSAEELFVPEGKYRVEPVVSLLRASKLLRWARP